MAYSHYDRLSALDASFLALEDHNSHMHVGSVAVFDAAPLRTAHGGIDYERLRLATEAGIAHHSRFRQRLAWVPLFDHPVWVDDERFNLTYHLRHSALPAPGDLRQLKRMAARIMSQQLDRGKPLWEMWFIENLEGDRFAIITKLHHCMVDGLSGADLLAVLMRVDDDASVVPPAPWIARPRPTHGALLAAETVLRATAPLAALSAARAALREPRQAWRAVRDAVEGIGQALGAGLWPATPTPLNVAIGPHRRFDWIRFELSAAQEIKRRLGGTVNDVVLAVVSGAMRHFLEARGECPNELDFRAMVPVSMRGAAQRGTLGNRVSFLMAQLPIDEPDARRRLERVIHLTQQLKSSKQVRGAEVLEELSDRTFTSLLGQLARLGAQTLSYNMVVTNVPGPPFPIYMLGAPMREIYPLVPLFSNQGLGIALFSYNGGLFWGLNADWDAVPDLHELVALLQSEFALLQHAAAQTPVALPAIEVARAARGRATRVARRGRAARARSR